LEKVSTRGWRHYLGETNFLKFFILEVYSSNMSTEQLEHRVEHTVSTYPNVEWRVLCISWPSVHILQAWPSLLGHHLKGNF